MKRLRKEVEEELNALSKDVFGMFDNLYMSLLNVTTRELDYISANISNKELEEFSRLMDNDMTFGEKKQIIYIRNKYLKQMNEEGQS